MLVQGNQELEEWVTSVKHDVDSTDLPPKESGSLDSSPKRGMIYDPSIHVAGQDSALLIQDRSESPDLLQDSLDTTDGKAMLV